MAAVIAMAKTPQPAMRTTEGPSGAPPIFAPRTPSIARVPLCEFMTCERYVFDIVLRYSGAAAVEQIGPIAATFGRQIGVFETWLSKAGFRCDIDAGLQAERVRAFILQAMALKFCALHNA
jgi:hypothetical protein